MADEGRRANRGLAGFLGGVTEVLERLEQLAESGGEISRTGTIPPSAGEEDGGEPRERTGAAKAPRGVYGFSVRMGLGGGPDFRVEPFGNLRRDRSTGESVVEEVREPLVDVFDEGDRLLIVAELPGVDPEDVRVDVGDGLLTLRAERAERKYRKSIEVPRGTERDRLSVSCNHGIVEIGVPKPRR